MKSVFDNWADVRVFLAVFRTGSTLAASKRLGMSQPTVARRIDALEHALGLTLFERDTRGFRPTADARRLLEAAEAMEAAADALTGEARKARRADDRPIRFTAPTPNFSPNLATILSEFSTRNPGVRFELLSTYEVLDLAAGEADVAIRISRAIDDPRLICTKLTDVTSSIYGAKSYAERKGLPASPADLAGHSFVVVEKPSSSFLINQWLLDRVTPDQVVSRCSSLESVVAAIAAGLGLGPVPTSIAADHPELLRCFPPPEGLGVSSWLLIAPEAYRRPEVRAFSAFFAPRFRAVFRAYRQEAGPTPE